jgi:hypothetical protein
MRIDFYICPICKKVRGKQKGRYYPPGIYTGISKICKRCKKAKVHYKNH